MSENIFLVGPMGVGKTTIGSHLARKLKYDFVDSDTEIEKRTGASISLIFDIEGEEGFRKREAQMIDELTQRHHIVLSTGGGSVLDETSRQNLRSKGYVVYLKASVEILYLWYRRVKCSKFTPRGVSPDGCGSSERSEIF